MYKCYCLSDVATFLRLVFLLIFAFTNSTLCLGPHEKANWKKNLKKVCFFCYTLKEYAKEIRNRQYMLTGNYEHALR